MAPKKPKSRKSRKPANKRNKRNKRLTFQYKRYLALKKLTKRQKIKRRKLRQREYSRIYRASQCLKRARAMRSTKRKAYRRQCLSRIALARRNLNATDARYKIPVKKPPKPYKRLAVDRQTMPTWIAMNLLHKKLSRGTFSHYVIDGKWFAKKRKLDIVAAMLKLEEKIYKLGGSPPIVVFVTNYKYRIIEIFPA